MPEIKEDVLVSVQFEQDDGAFKKLADLKGTLVGLKEEQKNLGSALKAGAITQKEYNSEIVRVEALQKKANAEYSKTQRSVTGLKNPFDTLNETLKNNGERTKVAGAEIDKMTGGLYGQAKAIATTYAAMGPLAWIIGAVGIAVASVTAYFKGSEEGQDKLAKVMAVGKVVWDTFLVAVEKVGGALVSVVEIIGSGVNALLNVFSPASSKLLNQIIKEGAAIADLMDKIEARENEMIVNRAKTDRDVAELREKAIKSEGAQKRAFVEEAIRLEKKLAAEELMQANLKLSHFEREAKASGENTEEQKKKRAELQAAVFQAEAQSFESTKKFQKELESLKDEELKTDQQRAELRLEQEAIERANRHAASREADEIELADLSTRKESELQITNTFGEATASANESIAKRIKIANDSKIASDKEVMKARQDFVRSELSVLSILTGGLQQLGTKYKALAVFSVITQKAQAIGNIIANIAVANAKAIAVSPLTFGQPWVGLNTIAGGLGVAGAVSSGIDAINQINSAPGFARSGITGTKINERHGRRINRSNGDNLLVTAKIGEVILNKDHQAMLGGDDTFRRMGVPGFASSGMVSQTPVRTGTDSAILRDIVNRINTIQTVLVIEDYQALDQKRVSVQERATI